MPVDKITVRGARTHNLKNINVDIPRDQLVVITGLSGSGKSSLAFDTIFAEGQRRYVESLSAYARQFLGQMEKPDVDQIEGLSPAVSIDQTGQQQPRARPSARSRKSTTTCACCTRASACRTARSAASEVQMQNAGSDRRRGGRPARRPPHSDPRPADQRSQGPSPTGLRGHPQGRLTSACASMANCTTSTTTIELDRYKNHTIEAVVDRLIIKSDLERSRLTDSIETALHLGDGMVIVNDVTDNDPVDHLFSEKFACPYDGTSLPGPRAAHVLVQLAARRVRNVPGAGHQTRDRSAN